MDGTMRPAQTIRHEIRSATDEKNRLERRIKELQRELAAQADGFPRIAKARRSDWDGREKFYLCLGVYERYGRPNYITREIRRDGTLGNQTHGSAIHEFNSQEPPEWLSSEQEKTIISQCAALKRKWALKLLAERFC